MSEQEEKQNKLNQFDQFEEEVQNILDPYKLLIVFKRSFMAMLLISLITFIGVIIYIRYAKPVYESSSIIQLENNNRTNSLGILSSNRIFP